VRTFLPLVPIAPDATWLNQISGIRPLVGAVLALALLASVLTLVAGVLYGAWAHRNGQGAVSRGLVAAMLGALILGSLSGLVGFGMGAFHFS